MPWQPSIPGWMRRKIHQAKTNAMPPWDAYPDALPTPGEHLSIRDAGYLYFR